MGAARALGPTARGGALLPRLPRAGAAVGKAKRGAGGSLWDWAGNSITNPNSSTLTKKRRRVFPDAAYATAGAEVTECLQPASVLLGVKQPSPDSLLPDRYESRWIDGLMHVTHLVSSSLL